MKNRKVILNILNPSRILLKLMDEAKTNARYVDGEVEHELLELTSQQ